jgi:carbamoyl-phosphate synthase large subunit
MIVLLSPAGGRAMHGIIEYFFKAGHYTIGIDGNPEATGRHFVDRFYCVPRVDDPRYPETLLDVIRKERVDMFVGWLDPEILFWNERANQGELRSEMAKVHTFNLRPDLGQFYDKLECAKMLKREGFLVPGTVAPAFGSPMPELPCILKPCVSTGSRDVVKIEDEVAWDFHTMRLAHKGRFVAQEFIDGPEYTVDFFADKGTLVNVVVRQRLEHQGVSLRGEVVRCPGLVAIVESIVSRFSVDGLNNMQFIERGGGYYAIDFNPRPSGTIMLSVRAGVDMLNNLIERKQGKPLTRYGEPRRLKMVRYLAEHYYE